MVRQRKHHVTDTELGIMKVLWAKGPSTIRQLTDLLYPSGGTAHYATVQKLLERLEKKSFVSRRRSGRANEYAATVDRMELVARRLRETADRLCEGSLAPLLTQLVSSGDLTREELTALRELVERLDRENPKG